ncbi:MULTISPECIES: hypothetical protein [Pantoea]|jgi:hypothetical protein|uniref:hypothetical protein n=1 Tax=unclassified Pantoea TaxID=2630326 RepID=UPI000D78C6D1|nr:MULTISPECIES: hypothetical protein [Pantoea]AWP32182.1 hypothetical protein B9D02_06135 [Pantoea vagans]MDF2040822.1 hypothetical protein [Pantoea sp. Cr_R14]MDF2071229.1 hypothetical protein [Pantoea sp. Cr_R13]MDF2080358.1 hypothetical protein [Pantoea sp. Cr_R21]
MTAFTDMKIKALRMFSHFHLGTVSQGEVKVVKKEIGEALVGLHLAEAVEDESNDDSASVPVKKGGKSGNKPATGGAG